MPKIIDLFAGAGGLSLGAARAGFRISAAVELDPFAFDTHIRNFPNSVHLNRDVSELTGKELLALSGLQMGELDGLIGGPPCQGFSSMGKRDIEDIRNNLFGHFFRLVEEAQPAFFLAENVPGILDSQYDEIRENAFAKVKKSYHLLPPMEIKANLYGAPTTRKRIFFIGYKPNRFHSNLQASDFEPSSDVVKTVVKTALQGLPQIINPMWLNEIDGLRPIGKMGENKFFNQVSNHVPLGVGNPETLFHYHERGKVSGCMGTRHTPEVIERYSKLLFGQQDKTSRAIRLDPNGFCPTLRAGTAKDKGSFQAVRPIHYKLPRVITPREGARLQGFPDWFVFHRTKWHSFRQIGNSVSPIVAEAILSLIAEKLK